MWFMCMHTCMCINAWACIHVMYIYVHACACDDAMNVHAMMFWYDACMWCMHVIHVHAWDACSWVHMRCMYIGIVCMHIHPMYPAACVHVCHAWMCMHFRDGCACVERIRMHVIHETYVYVVRVDTCMRCMCVHVMHVHVLMWCTFICVYYTRMREPSYH